VIVWMLKNFRYLIFIRRLKNVKIYLIHVSILLVSIGILKGVELVVILSQFNFQTLTTFVYQYTTDVQINLVSLFTLSCVGFVPLSRTVVTIVINILQPMRTSEEAV
jgi:ABC-type Fe3+ transport system permease subunit